MGQPPRMAKVCLPVEFQQSYLNYLSYPQNIILNGTRTYHSTLQAYKARLDAVEADLCLENGKDVLVPIRDLHGPSANGIKALVEHPPHDYKKADFGADVVKCNVHTAAKLNQCLGAKIHIDEADPKIRTVTAPEDPKCRFMYAYYY
jgi:hypothetical protein